MIEEKWIPQGLVAVMRPFGFPVVPRPLLHLTREDRSTPHAEPPLGNHRGSDNDQLIVAKNTAFPLPEGPLCLTVMDHDPARGKSTRAQYRPTSM